MFLPFSIDQTPTFMSFSSKHRNQTCVYDLDNQSYHCESSHQQQVDNLSFRSHVGMF